MSRPCTLIGALISLVISHFLLAPKICAQGRGPSPVRVSAVEKADLALEASFLGTVIPRRTSPVGSRAEGHVVSFPVRKGDRLKKGDVIAQLSTRLLEIEIRGARAALSLRTEELLELKNGSRPEEIRQALAHRDGAQSIYDYTRAKLSRMEDLLRMGQLASQDELEETRSQSLNAFQLLEAAKARYEEVLAGPRKEKIEQARVRELAQQEAVRRLEFLLSLYTIKAPFDGYITTESTEVGAWLNRGGHVVDLVDLEEVDIRIYVGEDMISGLDLGAPCQVVVMALPGQSFEGKVQAVVPLAETKTREFPVLVRVGNPGHRLKAGMTARALLQVAPPEPSLLVEKDALVLGGATPLVFVVDRAGQDSAEGTVRPVSVVVGESNGSKIQIQGDLHPGQDVVIRGNERLRAGQSVLITKNLDERGSRP